MAQKPVSKNVGRLNQDLKREIIGIVDAMKDPRLKQGLLTITKVEAAQDLSTAKVFVSVMGEEPKAAAEVVAALDSAKGHVRSEISSRMHIRRAPELIFIEDDNAAYADHINKVLKELDEK
ncbi:30S ribosome-binding factor RbfA [Ruminococcaceae bacterium OttesenSCG-928-I18]|nr:30S ribosome-binding factor RbfA [Ruminococcaceae bacterium OttesenSCG-928-I18]